MKESKNRLAIVHCVHHKPWLIMSTLITTLSQNYKEFDIYFLHQVGHGDKFYGEVYKEYFDEYYGLVEKYGINQQLDSFDSETKDACSINRRNVYHIEFENDHALDSGAWYKFIKKKLWKGYDHVLFMGEGALLTGSSVLGDTMEFVKKNNIDFITGAQEKRKISKDKFLNKFVETGNEDEMGKFHDKMIQKTFEHFCRDQEFVETMKKWTVDFDTVQQHHVPDVWGKNGNWLKRVSIFYPNGSGRKSIIKNIVNKIIVFINNTLALKKICYYFLLLYSRYLFKSKKSGLTSVGQKKEGIFVNNHWVDYSDLNLTNYNRCNNVKFHSSDNPAWFGATCNFFVSSKFLDKFSDKLKSNDIYDMLDLPFSATALEIIWGEIPIWLGFEKHFFDGIHRVRKNFVNNRREDDPDGMVRYINKYYQGELVVKNQDNKIKIVEISKEKKHTLSELNSLYR
jgi:hypothetical protein